MDLTLMHPKVIVMAVVVALIIVAAVALYIRQRKQTSAGLRARFGTEYERAVRQHGSARKAEAREARVELLKIRDLDPTERDSYRAQPGRQYNPVLSMIRRGH